MRAAPAFSTHIRKVVPQGTFFPSCTADSESTTPRSWRQPLALRLSQNTMDLAGGTIVLRLATAAARLASPWPQEHLCPGSRGKAQAGRIESWLQDPAELPKQTASSLGALAFLLPPRRTKSISVPSRRRAGIASKIPGCACSHRLNLQPLLPGES